MIEQTACKDKRNAAQMFLDEWSTMGRKRPTLRTLLDLLMKAELFRAADYVACDILKQERPKRPDCGPAASVDISDTVVDQLLKQQQIHQLNVFGDSLILGSASEFVSEVNGPCDNVANDANKIANTNLLDIGNDGSCEKPADILFETVSNLRNCSVADKTADNTDKATNECAENTSVSTRSSESDKVKRDANKLEEPNIPDRYYKYEEVSSQELPVFINNPKQSVAAFDEEMCSSDIPLCLKF
ncbi:uncharacterized protein LOC109858712 [Pseudomyrmex gracilis]|uniref:uncharacterized protein LOC109858712 n=1 Tax=Pseudomyrmex gracilis TaxID=219809 RepID=UPI000994D01B|nr:uncharacterized protein LOC109858712 [Pseudomyrmex gracilis]XP_020291817.1 uncharacterized protein LOC109858712 [Pseudomyrmex gracilis]